MISSGCLTLQLTYCSTGVKLAYLEEVGKPRYLCPSGRVAPKVGWIVLSTGSSDAYSASTPAHYGDLAFD